MRYYLFHAMRPGGYMFFPGKVFSTENKIRVAVIDLFRRWFGSQPNFHWHKDGFMAEAWDEKGNIIQLEQFNINPKTQDWE